MRRSIVIALAITLSMIGITPASASDEYWVRYGTPSFGQGDLLSGCLSGDPPLNSCVVASVPEGASSVSITIIDDVAPVTYGTVGQDFNDDGLTDQSRNFCDSTGQFPVVDAVPIGNPEIIVFPHALPGAGDQLDALCPGFATSGWVVFDFS